MKKSWNSAMTGFIGVIKTLPKSEIELFIEIVNDKIFDKFLYTSKGFITLYLKVVSATFSLVWFLSQNERTCQTRKNAFYFTSKPLFILEKIKF